MGIVKRFLGFDDPRAWTPFSLSAMRPTASGVSVDENMALTQSTVYACVRVISEDLASLPLILYQRVGEGKERAFDHPLYSILHDAPNPEMTSMSFWEAMLGHLLLWGNFYAYIQRDTMGRVRGLWPWVPWEVTPKRTEAGDVAYQLNRGGQQVDYPADLVFHVPGYGFNGLMGLSAISLHRETVGYALGMQEYGARFYDNDASSQFLLVLPNKMSDKARGNLISSWENRHKGIKNRGKTGILEEGVDVKTIGITPIDAQYLETRKFTRTEICSIFRVPPHMVMDLERATFSNIESQALSYVSGTLRPHATRIERTILTKLLTATERKTLFAEHLFEDLLRGDVVSRNTAYNVARLGGWMNADEIRARENMNPMPDGQGQVYFVPKNYGDLAKIGEAPPPPPPQIVVPAEEVEPTEPRSFEYRTLTDSQKRRMAEYKYNVANSFKPVIEDAVRRTTSKEVKDLKAMAKKAADVGHFTQMVEEYYLTRQEVLIKDLTPCMTSLAEAILTVTADECKGLPTLTGAMQECLNEHILNTCKFNALAAKNTVLKAVREARELTFEEFEIEAFLAGWVSTRPEMFAAWETARVSGLMSNANYFQAGADGAEWLTLDVDDARCAHLNEALREYAGSCRHSKGYWPGSQHHRRDVEDFTPSWEVSTPPLYLGCTCQLVPYWRKS